MKNTMITIPQPCHQDWNAMTPEQQGRYCKSCEKIVVDFTHKTPAEIKETLMQSTGKVCGRIKRSDLNRPLEEQPVVPVLVPVRHSWFKTKWMAAAAVFTALFIGKKAQAQELLGEVATIPEPPQQNQQACKSSPTMIHGQIKSLDPSRGLSQVEIKVYSNGKEVSRTFAFNSGYVLTVPEHTIWDFKVTVESSAMGFETKVIKDVPVTKDQIALDILMVPLSDKVVSHLAPVVFEPEYYVMGDIVEEPPVVVGQMDVLEAPVYEMGDVKIEPEEDTSTNEIAAHPNRQTLQQHAVNNPNAAKPGIKKVVVSFPEFLMKAFPNPSTGIFNLSLPKGIEAEIFVYDLEGKLILSRKTNSDLETFDISDAPNGVYLIKAIQPGTNKTAQARVIKTK